MSALEHAKAYFRAIEARTPLDAFFAEDVVQREHPNRLVPNGATRDRAALREAALRGARVVCDERYVIVNAVEQGDRVALEVLWSATLRVPVGTLAVGETMRACFGVFMTFRDGLIASQTNYDCFDPF